MESTPRIGEAIHPCVKCGACCAYYRVLFDATESTADSLNVPKDLTEKIDAKTRVMMGTNQVKPRCIALSGQIGKSVGCTIYSTRPSCCRAFSPSYETGLRNPRCDEARRAKGLKALQPRDWFVQTRTGEPSP